MIELTCTSVPGGWQTEFKTSGYRFGPVFNRIQELWAWQREFVYGNN